MPESTETTTAATEAAAPVVAPATVAAVAQAAQAPAATAPVAGAENVADLPQWAQDLIASTRAEAGAARTTAKATAAQEARDALVQEFGKTLGLVKDGEDAPTSEQVQAEARSAKVELAVFKAAIAAGADAGALLDSRSFLDSIKDITPTDTAAITAAITAATTNNPRLKATQAAARSGADLTGGTGEGAITKAAFDVMTPSQKNDLFQKNPTLYRTLTGR